MELSNILLEEMTLKIGRFYGEIWIEIQICMDFWEKSMLPERNTKYGILPKSKDTLITNFTPILEEKCW